MAIELLEDHLTPLDPFQWELGGLRFGSGQVLRLGAPGDEGLDDVSEYAEEDAALAGDGSESAAGRLAARPITLRVWYAGPSAEHLEATLDEIRKVVSPLPNRKATRLLRWRRAAGPAWRIAVKAGVGKPLDIPGDRDRLLNHKALITIRLAAPDPMILSDFLYEESFTAGQTKTITNAGTFTAVRPTAWSAEFPGPVTVSNLTYGEAVRFTAAGTVQRSRSVSAGRAERPGGRLLMRYPLLRPGDQEIKATGGPMTFQWRYTR
jgi:hypothetical protein